MPKSDEKWMVWSNIWMCKWGSDMKSFIKRNLIHTIKCLWAGAKTYLRELVSDISTSKKKEHSLQELFPVVFLFKLDYPIFRSISMFSPQTLGCCFACFWILRLLVYALTQRFKQYSINFFWCTRMYREICFSYFFTHKLF